MTGFKSWAGIISGMVFLLLFVKLTEKLDPMTFISACVVTGIVVWGLCFKKKNPKATGDGKLHCPECDTTKLRVLGIDEAPFQRYSTPFECENGHLFNRVSEGEGQ